MRKIFFSLFVLLLTFVWVPGLPQPDTIATHFDASGRANGFMSRRGYHWFMTGLVLFISLVTVWLPGWLISRSDALLSLPNKKYWMSIERKADSMGFMDRWLNLLGILILSLIGYVHWLVVKANQAKPPSLASDHLIVAVLVFVLGMTGLIIQFYWRFRISNRANS